MAAESEPVRQRLHSLDTYRGLIMVTLAFEGFGLAGTAQNWLKANPDSGFWEAVLYQFSHTEWTGCSYWDMIQPSFMFMVGVSMAYSYLRRQREGHSYDRMLGHAVWRSIILVFLGIFLISNWGSSTVWSLMNVLSQIGLGYAFLFLCWGKKTWIQATVAAAVLVVTWIAYVAYSDAGIDLEAGAPDQGINPAWAQTNLEGVDEAWHKNANVGHVIDLWLLNLLPQKKAFEFNSGGYQTINFIPSLATMIFGLMCGELLRSDRTARRKLQILLIAGVAGLVAGQVLHMTGLCPIVKRIWTPAWALFSTGWCCLILAALYGIIDVLNYRRWAFPLVVVGMNSIAIYAMGMLLKPWVQKTFKIHLSQDIFLMPGENWEPFVESTLTGLVFWCVCLWMYRRKIFLRI